MKSEHSLALICTLFTFHTSLFVAVDVFNQSTGTTRPYSKTNDLNHGALLEQVS